MKALRFDTELRVCDVEDPQPGPGEAVVELRRAGLCATDHAIVAGYAGFRGTLGHEMVGDVLSCPSEPNWVGRRVVPEINVWCGACEQCRAGRPTHCARRKVLGIRGLDGAFAERVVVPAIHLHRVPETVDDDRAVFAEPLAAALRILEQVPLGPGDTCSVLGDGKLGLLIAAALGTTGARITVVGRHPAKLAIAQRGGATVELCEAGAEGEVGSGGAVDQDVVVEATGTAAGISEALRRVRPQGTVVVKSTVTRPTEVDLARIVVDEIAVVGSRCGSIAAALQVLQDGLVDPLPLLTAVYPLARGVEAFAHSARRDALKVLLTR